MNYYMCKNSVYFNKISYTNETKFEFFFKKNMSKGNFFFTFEILSMLGKQNIGLIIYT